MGSKISITSPGLISHFGCVGAKSGGQSHVIYGVEFVVGIEPVGHELGEPVGRASVSNAPKSLASSSDSMHLSVAIVGILIRGLGHVCFLPDQESGREHPGCQLI